MRWLLAAVIALLGSGASAETPCSLKAPCAVDGGEYYLAFPDDWDGRSALPAVMFFHGHRSSGASVVKSASLRRAFAGKGYLIIGPNGALLPGRSIRAWPARPQERPVRDDIAFVGRVLDDVARRVPLQRDRILASGFSAGGSMAWMLACHDGSRFAAFVSVAGALRRPVPEEGCTSGPARMLHFHGFADRQVPLEGRGIRDWHQGDVFESLDLLRRANACRTNPTTIDVGTRYSCRVWTDCGGGRDIQFCLHNGGHMLPRGWAEKARTWFESEPGGS